MFFTKGEIIMNNIYKVIWSKAKNCYVVASEIARAHTKSASGSEKIGGVTKRSLLASLMALSLLCGGLGIASAADVTVHVDASLTPSAATEVYTTTGVNTLLDKKADKTALDTKANETEVVKNTTNIATNTANIHQLNGKLNDLTTTVSGKADAADVNNKLAQKADKTALEAKADITYVDQKFTEAGNNVNAKLVNYATTTEVDDKIAAEATARDTAINTAIIQEQDARDGAIKTAINGEVANRNQEINKAITQEVTARDLAVTNAKTDLQHNITAEETARKEADTAFNTRLTTAEGKIGANETAIGDLKAADTALEGKITKNTQDIAMLNGKVATAEGNITDLKAKDTDLEKKIQTNADNIQTNSNAIDATNKRTSGIEYNNVRDETTIENNVTVDSKGNVTAEGKLTGKGVDAGDGAITTTGAVNAGSLNVTDASHLKGDVTMDKTLSVTGDTSLGALNVTGESSLKNTQVNGTLTTTGKATFKEAVDMDKGLTVTSGDTTLQNTDVKGALNVTGESSLKNTTVDGTLSVNKETTLNDKLTANGEATFGNDVTVKGTTNLKGTMVDGDLKVTGTITTDRMVFGDPATNNYTEIDHGKVTSKNSVVNGEGQKITSSSIFNAEENKVGFANNATGDQSFHKQTSDIIMDNVKDRDNSNYRTQTKTETKDIIKDKDGNSSTTSQTASKNKTYLKDKDGKNINSTIDTAKEYDKTIKGENGETSTKQDELNITNTAKNGTITNDAQNIVNNASGNITNKANTMDTNVTGKATESYGELETNVNGKATENFKGGLDTTVTGAENHTVTGKQTNTVEGGQENIISGGQINNITGDQTTTISGTQTTTATDIKRNASSGMIDTIDNDYGTNTETKVAGKTTTDVSIKGTGEKGQYIRGANESRDYLIKGTLKNSETKTVEKTSTEITDGTNKASTIQDAKNLAGSVTNGTETGVSGIHANDDGSVSIDSGVTDGTNTSVQKQTASAIATDVKDGAGNENASVATATTSANTIKSGSKANTVISTADGTSFINSEAAAPVTGASGAGTAVNTTIKGNTITTGKVTMDYAEVMKDLGVHGNAKVDQNLEVGGTSTLKGDVTMESNATVKKDLKVEGTTTTQTLKVTENAEIDGTLKVAKKATFEDSVSIAKDLSVGGDVTANSYKVGDKTYIDANGIHANGQKITDVADGSISEGSKDAVNGGQLYGVKRDLEHQVDKVGANAAAMANLRPMEFDPSSKWNIAAAIGNYGSETAAALGAFYRPNDDVMVNLSTAFGTGENMVGGGVSVRLGKSGNKLSREENNALKAQVDDLTARMDALLSVLNPNMSKDFPDVPENHWAYEAVSRLAGNDIVQGYPDGEFHGERTMTRYEMAEIIYNALSRGAEAERELVEEFKPELQAMAASEKATAEKAEG